MSMKFRGFIQCLCVAGILFFSATRVHAHRVTIFAWVEGDRVHTESRFSGGKAVVNGKIIVYDDRSNKRLLEGVTDAHGNFSFKVPRKTRMRIELLAGAGHRNKWILKEDAFGMSPPTTPSQEVTPGPGKPMEKPDPNLVAAFESTLERLLDKKLSPVMKQLARMAAPKTTLKDVLGGIGYIFGMIGVGMYFHYRSKLKS